MKKIFLFIFFSYWIFFFLIPPFQTPDEGTHFDVVYWLSLGIFPKVPQKANLLFSPENVQFALFQQVDSFAQNIPNYPAIGKSTLQKTTAYTQSEKKRFQPLALQAYNPPLYYIVASFFLRSAQFFHTSLLSQLYIVRLTSSLFYFLTLGVTYKVFLALYKKEKVANGLILFFGLNPLLMQSGVGISPDIALIFFTAWVFLCIVSLRKEKLSLKNAIIVGLLVGMAALSKITAVILIPGFLLYLFLKKKNKKEFLLQSTVFLFTVALLLFPWLMDNYLQYHRVLMTTPVLGYLPATYKPFTVIGSVVTSIVGFRHVFLHFSGFLGWNDIFPFSFIFIPYTILFFIFFFVGLIILTKQKEVVGKVVALSTGSLFFFFLLIDVLRKVQSHQTWEIGGRDALFMLLPFVICITSGITFIFRKKTEQTAMWLGYFAIWYYYFILVLVVIPRFYV